MKKCPTPIGVFRDLSGKIIPARCNSWKCPYCSKIKKKRVLDRVSNGFKERQSVFGVTLTEVTESEHEIMQHWKKFRENLQKHFGFKLKFFWVKEFQKNNNRHIHVLIDFPIDHALIKKTWAQATCEKAYIVWINEYAIKKSAGYLAKYLTKSCKDDRFNKSERRYSFSHDDGFVLDMKTAFEKYGFLPPKKGTFLFQIGRPIEAIHDTFISKEIYTDDNFYIEYGTAKRKTVFDSKQQKLVSILEKGGYPDSIIYYPKL